MPKVRMLPLVIAVIMNPIPSVRSGRVSPAGFPFAERTAAASIAIDAISEKILKIKQIF